MNYGEYMRKKERAAAKIVGYQMGQDASQVTLRNQGLATTRTLKTITGNDPSFNGVPFTVSTSDANSCTRVISGLKNADATQNIIGLAQRSAHKFSMTPHVTVIPCSDMLSTITNAPSTQSCVADPGQIFRNPTELIANQARQASIRSQYNLPSKLDSLRGPVANIR
uniref:Uncharacterized protein n=1 Tax=viral metagenome TaxID=1070528 RepID=A0A6C0L927_9ZZZZ